jgi:hypothetical protein
MSYSVFISSKRKDLDVAQDLAKRLDKAGLKVITPVKSIDDSENFKKRIDSLKKADEVLVLVTVNSVDSKRLTFDMGVATSLEKRLTPIVLGVQSKKLPSIFKEMDYIKYADMDSFISKLKQRAEESTNIVLERMTDALRSAKFVWRTIERLAIIGGVSETEALRILRNDPEIVFSKGKSGKRIAKLKSR